MQDIKVMGNSMSKQVVNGEKGYIVVQGQRKDMSEEELNKLKDESLPFPELDLLLKEVTLEGVEVIDGKKAYELKLSDEKSTFYNIESGLKVRDVMSVNVDGQVMVMTLDYGDYKEVAGIKFPFLLTESMGPQKWNFIIQEIKVNEGVSDVDFE